MKSRVTVWALAFGLAVGATSARAQVQDQNSKSADPSLQNPSAGSQPEGGASGKRPAGAARGVSAADDPQPYDPSQVTPDTSTLAGAQLLGVGSLTHARNIFDPFLSVSEFGQINPRSPGLNNYLSETLFGGGLNFNRTWSRYHLTAVYIGGVTLNRGQYTSNTPFHELGVMQEINWARWHLLLRDDFVATPGAAFTGTGVGGPGLIAQISSTIESSLNSVGQGFVPSESIQNGNAMRYRNSALGQVEYSLTRRSTFTVAGSYGLLQFPGAGFINSHMLNAQAGYDYVLDPADSVGILAGYGKIDYTGSSTSSTNYLGALAYGRRITGRLAFQVAGGPEQIRTASAAGAFQLWYASVTSALTYELRRTGLSLTYLRGLSSGSGVIFGSRSNVLTFSAHRRFTRDWTGSVSSGYAINQSLAPAGAATVRFDNWFAGASIGRGLGRHIQTDFTYAVQRQNNPGICPATSCGLVGLQQTFGITANFHLRPIE
jgi:hypothetical protein